MIFVTISELINADLAKFCCCEITSIRINSITVTRFPPTSTNGASWDFSSDCDIYPTIELNGTTIYKSDEFYQDAEQNTVYTFTLTNVLLYSVQNIYVIKLLDYDDLDADDYMGEVAFTPYLPGIGFQENIIMGQTSPISFTLNLSYNF